MGKLTKREMEKLMPYIVQVIKYTGSTIYKVEVSEYSFIIYRSRVGGLYSIVYNEIEIKFDSFLDSLKQANKMVEDIKNGKF